MATVQSSKVAVQYGQHYSPNVMSAPVQSEHHYAHGQALQHPQQQHHQQIVTQPKPTILNHKLNGLFMAPGQMEATLVKLDSQPVPQHQVQQSKMWLLVEWESPTGESNSYSVIDSSDLVLQNGHAGETIHTGKHIFVRRGKKLEKGTVAIISDDRQFIETEMRQLRKIAVENHYRSTGPTSHEQSSTMDTYAENQPKRRRTDIRLVEEAEPASPEFEPMPVQSQIATANWVNNCKIERVISPSPSVISTHVANSVVQPKPPPMTFDQQTQTDSRFFPHESGRSQQLELSRMLSLQESILAEQKSVRMENEYNRKMMFDIMEQINSFSETLKSIGSKVESMGRYEITEVVKAPADNVSSYVVLGTGGEESRDRPTSVSDSLSQKPATSNENSNQMVIEQLSLHDDSNMSFNQSKYSIVEDSSSATSTPKNLNFSNRLSSSALSLSNASAHSQSNNSTMKSAVNEVLNDWNDDEGDDSDVTAIGPNNTLVKKQILRAINWTNYKAATRKLLMTLFSREMLASHTLTGRPSPAFMGDRAKPVKDKLDQRIISDIISIVTKTCNVSEPMVRTAITTKCADENKMSRMKHSKETSQTPVPQLVQQSIDIVGRQHQSPLSIATHARKAKRENKENAH